MRIARTRLAINLTYQYILLNISNIDFIPFLRNIPSYKVYGSNFLINDIALVLFLEFAGVYDILSV